MRGITPVVSVVLLLLITISILAFSFLFFQNITTTSGTQAQQAAEGQANKLLQTVEIIAVEDGQITVKNIGTQAIKPEDVKVFVDGAPIAVTNTPGNIEPGRTKTFTLDLAEPEQQDYVGQRVVEVSAPGNKVTKTTRVYVFEPNVKLTASPSSGSVTEGEESSYTITVQARNRFVGDVALTVPDCPVSTPPVDGSNCDILPSTVSIDVEDGSGLATLTVRSEGIPDPSTVKVHADSSFEGKPVASDVRIVLAVNKHDFTLSAAALSAQPAAEGTPATFTVTVAPVNGFNSDVTLGVQSCPGTSCTFSPAMITGSGTSTLTVNTEGMPASNSITVQGTATLDGTSVIKSATVSLAVETHDFALLVAPDTQSVEQTATAVYTVTITPLNNIGHGDHDITLTHSECPASATCTFDSSTIVASGAGPYTTNLRVTPVKDTPAAGYTLTVTGTYGTITHHQYVDLTVTAPLPKLVFVTSVSGNGKLGDWPQAGGATGRLAGNAICKALADVSTLKNTDGLTYIFPNKNWVAWLSTNTYNAKDGVLDMVYNTVANDGTRTTIVSNRGDLLDGNINNGIIRDENGVLRNSVYVWTGTITDGTRNPESTRCDEWTSDLAIRGAGGGVTSRIDSAWTQSSFPRTCDLLKSLYCFEVL